MMRRGPSIGLLLLGVNAFVLALPVAAIILVPIYDTYLLRQTERQLIAQSVVIAEAYHEAWLSELGIKTDENRPPGLESRRYVALEPLIDLGTRIDPANEPEFRTAPAGDTAARRAGKRIQRLIRRAQVFNLSGIRVLDADGCVVATTRGEDDKCLDALPEVRRAMQGHYASIARYRVSDSPTPPLGDIRRRGKRRVFTALPIFSNGQVIGVVGASRTGLGALSSLWRIRRGLILTALGVFALVAAISLLFARAIAQPVRLITRRAQAVAAGQADADFVTHGWTPAEIRLLSEALDDMTRELRSRATYVSEFATNVSHELKTPITAIRGATELLKDDWKQMDDAQRERFLDNIDEDADRMERLVTRLLTLARIENAAPGPAEPMEVEPFVRGLVERRWDNVSLRCEEPPTVVEISEEHLATVVSNLVDNAVRHGGDQPVEILLGSEAGRLLIQVSDRGSGVSEANRSKVWERFFTTDRDRGGTGLGLAMVKAIADSRRGHVDLETEAGRTTFTVVL